MEINAISRPKEINPDISSDVLEDFDYEVPVLNEWLCSCAFQNKKNSDSRTYVALTPESHIAGYFSLSNTVLSHDQLSAVGRRKKTDPIPCCQLAQLAVNRNFRGKGLCEALLIEALKITKQISKISSWIALIVRPKSDSESSFYEHFGFRKCKSGDTPLLFFEIENFELPDDEDKAKRMTSNGRKELNSMLAKITPENIHGRVDFGTPIGNELL